MYDYRRLSLEEQRQVVFRRLQRGFPAHEPPHIFKDAAQYFITAACYEHRCHLIDERRRRDFAARLHDTAVSQAKGVVHAWVVVPNHYHMLWEGELRNLIHPLR
jgi:putative transposase